MIPISTSPWFFFIGFDIGVGCLSVAAWALWMLGYPQRALQSAHEALTLAQKLSHPYSLGLALGWAILLHLCRRENRALQERVEEMSMLSTEQGFTQWLAGSTVHRGWALLEHGQGEEGVAQIHQGVAAWQATGAELLQPYHLALLAEGYRRRGQTAEGLTLLSEGLAAVEKTGERFYEAELHRLQGELLLQQVIADVDQAETCFQKALDIARRQHAKSWELRAAMSLSRLWQQQGKQDEARALLAPIYGWFTEGFDTKDLQEARALLDELQ